MRKFLLLLLSVISVLFADSICCYDSDTMCYWIEWPTCRYMRVGQLRPCGKYWHDGSGCHADLWWYWLHKTTKKSAIAYIEKWVYNGDGFEFHGNDTVDVEDAVKTDITPQWEIPEP